MKKAYIVLLAIGALFSCNDNLLEKPDNLISEDKMVMVLKDLALVNAAKSTSIEVLYTNDIEPMAYIYKKHGIDSLQFVESDRYYASLPVAYERIYKNVEAKIEGQVKVIEDAKKLKDSLANLERKIKNRVTDSITDAITDSLP